MRLPRVVLTPEEKKALTFIVVAFALGLMTQHYRGQHRHVQRPIEAQPAEKAKPSEGDSDE